MNRSHYINFITEKISALALEIEVRGKLNLLDKHLHAETFYAYFFNELFGSAIPGQGSNDAIA